ncbi:NADH-quinone oxidoreductase subunit C [Komagataeibacter sp. AV436]|uniref:NADH-quinone oxidoreductase subunit C n=1 Tax=Komagataeibacter melomenusus TaxID=2766578 RepID=A0ABX2AG64_9PROT|nr:NADH-quinone oxidoreductase subunit C [Komagataeibacter melomenusus]
MADVQNLPASQPRGVTGSLGAISFRLSTTIPGIMSAGIEKGELVVRTTRDRLLALMAMLRDDPLYACQQVMDICGVDFPDRAERFEVVYNLLSVTHNHRIRVIVTTDETHPVPSVHQLWPAATWWEREAYDLFGILFTDQPDLRRILTDYGFEGHPLRKDFPLTGYVEMRYDEERRQVVYEPVDLVQDFRNFDFESPWEGILTLPGDEKAHADRHDIKRKG